MTLKYIHNNTNAKMFTKSYQRGKRDAAQKTERQDKNSVRKFLKQHAHIYP